MHPPHPVEHLKHPTHMLSHHPHQVQYYNNAPYIMPAPNPLHAHANSGMPPSNGPGLMSSTGVMMSNELTHAPAPNTTLAPNNNNSLFLPPQTRMNGQKQPRPSSRQLTGIPTGAGTVSGPPSSTVSPSTSSSSIATIAASAKPLLNPPVGDTTPPSHYYHPELDPVGKFVNSLPEMYSSYVTTFLRHNASNFVPLLERIQSLESMLSNYTNRDSDVERQRKMNEEVAKGLKKEMERVSLMHEELERKRVELESSVGRNTQANANMDSNTAAAQAETMRTLEAERANWTSKESEYQQKLKDYELKETLLVKSLSDFQSDRTNGSERQGGFKDLLEKQEAKIKEQAELLASYKSSIGIQKTALESQKTTIDSHATTIVRLRGDLEKQRSKVSTLQDDVARLQNVVRRFEDEEERLVSIKAQLDLDRERLDADLENFMRLRRDTETNAAANAAAASGKTLSDTQVALEKTDYTEMRRKAQDWNALMIYLSKLTEVPREEAGVDVAERLERISRWVRKGKELLKGNSVKFYGSNSKNEIIMVPSTLEEIDSHAAAIRAASPDAAKKSATRTMTKTSSQQSQQSTQQVQRPQQTQQSQQTQQRLVAPPLAVTQNPSPAAPTVRIIQAPSSSVPNGAVVSKSTPPPRPTVAAPPQSRPIPPPPRPPPQLGSTVAAPTQQQTQQQPQQCPQPIVVLDQPQQSQQSQPSQQSQQQQGGIKRLLKRKGAVVASADAVLKTRPSTEGQVNTTTATTATTVPAASSAPRESFGLGFLKRPSGIATTTTTTATTTTTTTATAAKTFASPEPILSDGQGSPKRRRVDTEEEEPRFRGPSALRAEQSLIQKRMHLLLDRIRSRDEKCIFSRPVDEIKDKAPGYHAMISRPRDLQSIRADLTAGKYWNLDEFAEDVRTMFQNCWTYNANPAHTYHRIAKEMAAWFEELLAEAKLKVKEMAGAYKNKA